MAVFKATSGGKPLQINIKSSEEDQTKLVRYNSSNDPYQVNTSSSPANLFESLLPKENKQGTNYDSVFKSLDSRLNNIDSALNAKAVSEIAPKMSNRDQDGNLWTNLNQSSARSAMNDANAASNTAGLFSASLLAGARESESGRAADTLKKAQEAQSEKSGADGRAALVAAIGANNLTRQNTLEDRAYQTLKEQRDQSFAAQQKYRDDEIKRNQAIFDYQTQMNRDNQSQRSQQGIEKTRTDAQIKAAQLQADAQLRAAQLQASSNLGIAGLNANAQIQSSIFGGMSGGGGGGRYW